MATTCRAPDRLGGSDWFTTQRYDAIVVGNLEQILKHHGPNVRLFEGRLMRDVDFEEEQMIVERVVAWQSRGQKQWRENNT